MNIPTFLGRVQPVEQSDEERLKELQQLYSQVEDRVKFCIFEWTKAAGPETHAYWYSQMQMAQADLMRLHSEINRIKIG